MENITPMCISPHVEAPLMISDAADLNDESLLNEKHRVQTSVHPATFPSSSWWILRLIHAPVM